MLKSKINYITSFGIVLIILISHNSFGQTSDNDILNKRIEWDWVNPNIYQVCAILAAKSVPIGFEDTSYFENAKPDKIIHLETGTLREILNSLTKQDPNYKWDVRGGVVNIYPIRSRDESLKTFLDTKLKYFFSKKEYGRKQIADSIHSSDEVKAFLTKKMLKLDIATWTELKVENATKEINVSDADIRTILNQIVSDSSDSKRWLIQRTKNGEIFLSF
jgi:hypothetical protein